MSLRIPRFVRFSVTCDEFSRSCDFNPVLVVLATARVSWPLLVPAEVFLLHQAYHGTFLSCTFLSKFMANLAQKSSQSFRVEKDTFGDLQVPSDRYWGAQTQR
jgi:hypothetical protein